MKKLLVLLSFVLVSISVTAQSVLITPGAQSINGDSTNQNQLSAFGNGLLVAPKTKLTEYDPASNVHVMSCASEVLSLSLAGTLKEPTGDADYTAGISYECLFTLYNYDPNFLAYQIQFEVLDTEADGDTVYIEEYSGGKVIGAYSGSNLPASILTGTSAIRIRFKTDSDANVGAGFVLNWKAILKDGTTGEPQDYFGIGLSYDNQKNALWTGGHGLLEFKNRGRFSTALGYSNNASGSYSTAIGRNTSAEGSFSTALGYFNTASGSSSSALGNSTTASGSSSTAFGYNTDASGSFSTAFGYNTDASGIYSTAMGYETESSNEYSTAMGFQSLASGVSSTAMGTVSTASGYCSVSIGTRVSTTGFRGAMVLGDYVTSSSSDFLYANAENRFLARFENGYTFYTDNDLSSATKYGITAHNRANSWSSISDSTKKENFIPSNNDDVLNSVAQMRIGTWNYKGDDSSKNRHWGVMAQDFHHHFGKDAYGTIGNDTTIATADFDGVSFAAIKALEERTRELKKQLAAEKEFSASLEVKIEKLEAHNLEQYARLENDFKELKEMLLKSVALKED